MSPSRTSKGPKRAAPAKAARKPAAKKPPARPQAPPPPAAISDEYAAHRAAAGVRSRAVSHAGRDIGELPPVANPERREACRRDFALFCATYFQATCYLPFAKDQIRAIRCIERAVLHGGLYAFAMPRGMGKTAFCEYGCIWATFYGHREFPLLVGASELASEESLESIKSELETNDELAGDFPEICFPIRALEGLANRCKGQLHKGQRTRIVWTAKQIVLPTIEGSVASGAIIRVAGLTGRIRGQKFKKPDGETARPDVVVGDDLQTRESAESLSQCNYRERLLKGDVLGLAGPGKKIAVVMPCTVIRAGDLADTMLDRKKNPDWNGERTKLVYSFPKNEKLWEEYSKIRIESLEKHQDIRLATAFYKANRKAMDEGAEVAWKERFNPDELSAIQHAMNLKLQDEAAFFAEYQNEPRPIGGQVDNSLTVDQIAMKTNGYKRGQVPNGVDVITAFVDVQGALLYWFVVAWKPNFAGYVLDYGVYPDQGREYFTLANAQATLLDAAPGTSQEGAILAGLEALERQLLDREWIREDTAPLRISRMLIDANWSISTEVVYAFCRKSVHAVSLLPSHGKFIGAGGKPMREWRQKPGDRPGLNWIIPSVQGKRRAVRYINYDTNFWKSFIQSGLAAKMGDPGSISFFGNSPARHRLLAEHLTSEYRVRTKGRGRELDEWKPKPNRDNHWWDGIVGAAVAASERGVSLTETKPPPPPSKPRRKLSELQRERRDFVPLGSF